MRWEDLVIEVNATDDIGIARVEWAGVPFDAEGMFANGSIDEPGEPDVTVTNRDGTLNRRPWGSGT